MSFGDGAGWLGFLLDATLKATLALGVALSILWLRRRANPAARHFLLVSVVVGLLLIPFLARVLPSWEIALYPRLIPESAKLHSPLPQDLGSVAPAASPAGNSRVLSEPPPVRAHSWTDWVFRVWLLGAFLVFLRQVAGSVRAWKLRARSSPLQEAGFEALLERLAPSRNLQLRESAEIAVPAAVGFSRPLILLPAGARSWPDERRRMVLLHEIAHIRRGDVLSTVLAHITSIFYWFHPLVWLALRRLYIERERACDDYVLASSPVKATQYAGLLLEIGTKAGSRAWLSPLGVSMARKSSLEARIMSILGDRKRTWIPARSLCVFLGLLVFSSLAVIASLKTHPQGIDPAAEPAALSRSIQAVQTDEDAVRDRHRQFYEALEAIDVSRALDFFAGISEGEKSRIRPLLFLRNSGKDGSHSLLVVASGSFQRKIKVDSKISSVEKQGEAFLVTEELTITALDSTASRVLTHNPRHKLSFVREDGQWKIDKKEAGVVNVRFEKPASPAPQHIGLCLAPDGVKCLLLSGVEEDALKAVENIVKVGSQARR